MSTMNSGMSGSAWKAARTLPVAERAVIAVTIRSKAQVAICASAEVTGFLTLLEAATVGAVEVGLATPPCSRAAASDPPSDPPEPELPVELSLLRRTAYRRRSELCAFKKDLDQSINALRTSI